MSQIPPFLPPFNSILPACLRCAYICMQNLDRVMEAVTASCRAGALRRAVCHNVTNQAGKNLRECVSSWIDGAAVRA